MTTTVNRLVSMNISVLVIDNSEIIIIKSFEPNKTSGIESVSFDSVFGWDMTKYFSNRQQETDAVFLTSVNAFTDNTKPVRMKFSSNHKWKCYTT
jgi:hypothetical protein